MALVVVAAGIMSPIEQTHGRLDCRNNSFPKTVVSHALTDTEAFTQSSHLDHGKHRIQIMSANCRSIRRNECAVAKSRVATIAVEIARPSQSNGPPKTAARKPSMIPLSG